MTNLSEFLLARIAEDEEVARAVGAYLLRSSQEEAIEHADRWRPTRVLAECEAKRGIVADCVAMYDRDSHIEDRGPALADYVLAALALPYASHPDYDQAWRP